MKRRIVNYILITILFAIGITVGKFCNWGFFELSKEISIIDALTLFTTLGAALYISKILEKEVQDGRIEKELFISKISHLESILNSIEVLVEDPDCSYNKINNRIHSCRKLKSSVFTSINEKYCAIEQTRILKYEQETTANLNALKRLLTETPISQAGTPEISLHDGLANYSMNRILEINVEILSIIENLFRLKILINTI